MARSKSFWDVRDRVVAALRRRYWSPELDVEAHVADALAALGAKAPWVRRLNEELNAEDLERLFEAVLGKARDRIRTVTRRRESVRRAASEGKIPQHIPRQSAHQEHLIHSREGSQETRAKLNAAKGELCVELRTLNNNDLQIFILKRFEYTAHEIRAKLAIGYGDSKISRIYHKMYPDVKRIVRSVFEKHGIDDDADRKEAIGDVFLAEVDR